MAMSYTRLGTRQAKCRGWGARPSAKAPAQCARVPGFDLGVMFTKDGHMQLGNMFSQRQHAACACKQTPITPARNCFQDHQPRVKI